MKKKFYKLPVVLMLMTVIPFFAIAQIDPGGGPDSPIDGGLGVLVAAGAAYGIKKYREHKKQLEHKEEDIK